VLEIGTLGGYSTICMARALPAGGKIVTLEREERHATAARRNFATAGVSDRIDLMIGEAIASLESSAPLGQGRSTLSSSTPTSRTIDAIWSGRLGCPGREQ
jgi:predicted O-methyltransferase YrrM